MSLILGVSTPPLTLSHSNKSSNENTTIFTVCANGELEKLTSLLTGENNKAIELLNDKDEENKGPLHYLAYSLTKGSVNCLSYIIENFKDQNISGKDSRGWTPLHFACWRNNFGVVKLLIENGAEVDSKDDLEETPLHKAALSGNINCVQFLLENKANLNSLSTLRNTPLHFVSIQGHANCVEALLQRGAAIDVVNSDGQLAIENACHSGNLESLQFLLKHWENSGKFPSLQLLHHAVLGGNVDILNLVVEKFSEDVNFVESSTGITAMHIACLYGHSKCVQRLIELQAKVDEPDSNGERPVHKAARGGNVECLQLLLDTGLVKLDALVPVTKTTALHLACIEGLSEIVSFLVNNNVPVDSLDEEGSSPLHKAAFHGHVLCIKLLIEKGANIHLKDNSGSSPIHKAAWNGHPQCITALLECGAAIEDQDNSGFTPFLNAVYNNNLNCMKILQQNNCNIHATDQGGRGAAYIAALTNSAEAIQWSIENKININVRDSRGKSAFIIALQKGYEDIARFLARSGAELPTKDYDTEVTVETTAEKYNISKKLLEAIIEEEKPESSSEMDEEAQKLWTTGIQLFNTSPKKGIAYLRSVNVLGDSPKDVAEFLINCTDLNKKQIGDYLGEEEYVPCLDQFVQLLDFGGLEFDMALRRFLLRFRLPGEAQKIDRIMERFAVQYFTNNPTIFPTSDTVYLLAFATIMLNTDLHNPQIKKKMSKAEFLNNTKYISNGGALPREYMEMLYDKISADEIKMETEGKAFATAEKKGWLTKQGGQIKTWKRRWFILDNNCLYYFKTPQDSEPCGIIPLENLQVLKVESKRKYGLAICDPTGDAVKSARINSDGSVVKGNHQVFYIAAQTNDEMESWFNAINSNIHHNPFYEILKKQMQRSRASSLAVQK